MNVKSIVVALAAMLTVAGGAAAVTGTGLSDAGTAASGDVTAETTYTDGAVTVAVTQDGAPVENASVEVADEEYTTDANGTVTAESVDLEAGEELGVEVEGDGFEAELSYALQDGDLQLLEEEYEYEQAEDAEDEAEDEADDDEDEAEDDEGEADEAEDDTEDSDEDDGDEEEADADDEEASEEDDDESDD
ncbi:hypothetical protein BRD04_00965 [Halobacteriales archaeon QS_9_67_17]|nr:MAG: hypothetical protein BRD04_00965 [Halobacteriales archaeon QS_9_67_17]